MTHSSPSLAKNNFDLLRLLFAGTVCVVHAYELSGDQELEWIKNILSSDVAVKSFFVVSGFLIFMSFERTSSIFSYAEKRFRRLYPAYFLVVLLCAFSLAGISTKSFLGYFSFEWVKYLLANLSFLNFLCPTLPGVFDTNKMHVVNGALWTLKIEVLFYMSVPVFIYLFKRFGRLSIIVAVYFLSVTYTILMLKLAEQTGSNLYLVLGRQLPGQLSYFMTGAIFYYYFPVFRSYQLYFIICAILLFVIDKFWALPVFEPIIIATMVIFFAYFVYFGNFGKFGDFSYGMYILHFPIIQTFLHFGWLTNNSLTFLLAIILTTGIAAMLLWHLVEKQFLLKNNHYIKTSTLVAPNKTPLP